MSDFASTQVWVFVLGLAAALLWLLASIAAFSAGLVKVDLGEKPTSEHMGLRLSTDDKGGGSFLVNGMNVPTYSQIERYQRAVFVRNAISSALNGVAALSACGAAHLSFLAA